MCKQSGTRILYFKTESWKHQAATVAEHLPGTCAIRLWHQVIVCNECHLAETSEYSIFQTYVYL